MSTQWSQAERSHPNPATLASWSWTSGSRAMRNKCLLFKPQVCGICYGHRSRLSHLCRDFGFYSELGAPGGFEWGVARTDLWLKEFVWLLCSEQRGQGDRETQEKSIENIRQSPHNGILLGNKKEQSDACYNMEEPQKHPATWKKPDAKTTDCVIPLMGNVQKRHDGTF